MTIDEIVSTALPMLVVGGVLAAVGQGIAHALGESREGWRGVWHRTRALHPIAAGLALGLSSLPVPEAMGDGLTGRMLWFALAGALAVPIYEVWRVALARRAQ